MTVASGIIAGLLAVAVILTCLCSLGVLVMRNPFQRMQFCTPVASIAALLITIAVWIGDSDWQARLKMLCIAFTLFWMNAILSHATARAIRIRKVGHLEPAPEEKIPIEREKHS